MEADFIALSPDTKGLTKREIQTEFSPEKYNRKTDDATDELIRTTWENRLLQNSRIFNGSKFRLHQINWTSVSSIDGDRKVPVFCLGLTNYKDYLGTNCSNKVNDLQTKGLQNYDNAQAFMSDALGVGTFLITSDEQFVFLKRSQFCSEAQGLLDGPGGHAEPDMIEGIFTSAAEKISPDVITDELFDSIIREVVDEANIPRVHLFEPTLLGVTKNYTTGGRMSAEFIIKCRLSSTDVEALFKEGTQLEAEESTAILFRAKAEVVNSPQNQETWLEYAPATRARIMMYKFLQQKENKSKQSN